MPKTASKRAQARQDGAGGASTPITREHARRPTSAACARDARKNADSPGLVSNYPWVTTLFVVALVGVVVMVAHAQQLARSRRRSRSRGAGDVRHQDAQVHQGADHDHRREQDVHGDDQDGEG